MSAPTGNTTTYVDGIPVTRAAAEDEIFEANELTIDEQLAVDYAQLQAHEEHERQQLEAVTKKSKTKKRTSPQVEIDTSIVDHVDDSNKDAMTRRVTTDFCARIKTMDADERPPITEAGDQLVRIMDAYGYMWALKRGGKHHGASLSPRQLSDLVHTYHDIVLVAVDAERSRDNALMYLYNEAEGVWDIITDRVSGLIDLAADLVYGVDTRFLNEYEHHVRLAAEIKEAPDNPHDIFFPNGLYNYQTDEMREYTREDMVTAKLPVRLLDVDDLEVPLCHHGSSFRNCADPDNCMVVNCCVWTIEEAMVDWFGDNSEAGWAVLGAVIRARWLWRQIVWALGSGHNGKSTFLYLCENLVNPRSKVVLSVNNMTGRFNNSLLVDKSLVISHEADSTHVSNTSALKAIVSQDPLLIDRKQRDPINVRVKAFCIQATNEMPRFSDKSQGLADRFYPLEFVNRYKDSPYKIRAVLDDFIYRPEVLEYIVWRVIKKMDKYYELPMTKGVAETTEQLRGEIDKTLPWWKSISDQLEGDFEPFEALYAHYVEYMKHYHGGGGKAPIESMSTSWMNRVAEHATEDGWLDLRKPSNPTARMEFNVESFFLSPVTQPGGDKTYHPVDQALFSRYYDYDDDRDQYTGSITLAAWCHGRASSYQKTVQRPKRASGLMRESTWELVQEQGGQTVAAMRKLYDRYAVNGQHTGKSIYQLTNPQVDDDEGGDDDGVADTTMTVPGDRAGREGLENALIKWLTAPVVGHKNPLDPHTEYRVIEGMSFAQSHIKDREVRAARDYEREGYNVTSPLRPGDRSNGAALAASEWYALPPTNGQTDVDPYGGTKTIDGVTMTFDYLKTLRSVQEYLRATKENNQ